MGRKNRLFVGSDNGRRMAAELFSMTASCKRHGIISLRYLADVLLRLPLTMLRAGPSLWRMAGFNPIHKPLKKRVGWIETSFRLGNNRRRRKECYSHPPYPISVPLERAMQ